MNGMSKCYTELLKIKSFDERVEYLKTRQMVGTETFGVQRYLNQTFYHLPRWRRVRRKVILRDSNGEFALDLAHEDFPIPDGEIIIVHHINPVTVDDLIYERPKVFDEENLITVSDRTHRIIHYEIDEISLPSKREYVERCVNDTKLW